MDRSWIVSRDRNSDEYRVKVDEFLEFAYKGKTEESRIYCPCCECKNRFFVSKDVARSHIIIKGFDDKYKVWVFHGETFGSNQATSSSGVSDMDLGDNMIRMVNDVFGANMNHENECSVGMDDKTQKFIELLQEAECELYPGCKDFTKLSFVVRILQLKVLGGWTDNSFTLLLELLIKVFPFAKFPSSYYDARKITDDLGFSYQTWDVCPNDCMIYRGEDASLEECEICETSRYKPDSKKIAAKQMRYFPIRPRLQKLFLTSEMASLMRWHAEGRTDDGVMRHPADSQAWKSFDNKHPSFAGDSRNIRLGLVADGFNPFRSMSISHSTLPVVLIPYNLPPWLCMKQQNLILSVLVDGPKEPGNKIDVYLQPLIEELVELWNEGVYTYDASNDQMFTLRVSLLWTISDFPAYANLSGWSTKGKYACPCCADKTRSVWLTLSRKHCYIGHRVYLPPNHRFRKLKAPFDGKRELGSKPKRLSGSEAYEMVSGVPTEYNKEDMKLRHGGMYHLPEGCNWKKRSIFFELPYWTDILVPHNIDVLHTERNFSDNVLSTIFGMPKKSKDHINARLDLKEMGIRKAFHPTVLPSGKMHFVPGNFTMSKEERMVCCDIFKNIKLPDGVASNISKCVHLEERSISGLKSHDHHILMQLLLPLSILQSIA